MNQIKLTTNIPVDSLGREYPYIYVSEVYFANPLLSADPNAKASVKITCGNARLVKDGDNDVWLALPGSQRVLTIAGFAANDNSDLLGLAAQMISSQLPEWASAEVVDG